MKTLIRFTILSILYLSITSCSLSQGWFKASIEESIELAGAVIIGTVENDRDPNAFLDNDIYLINSEYYKGCGPEKVRITGYSSSSMCGIDTPEPGTKVIVFVCREADGWKLHRFTAYSGQFMYNDKNMEEILKSLGSKMTCETSGFAYNQCKNRKPRIVKPVFMPPIPVLLEPKPVVLNEKPVIVQNQTNNTNNKSPVLVEPKQMNQKPVIDSFSDSEFFSFPQPKPLEPTKNEDSFAIDPLVLFDKNTPSIVNIQPNLINKEQSENKTVPILMKPIHHPSNNNNNRIIKIPPAPIPQVLPKNNNVVINNVPVNNNTQKNLTIQNPINPNVISSNVNNIRPNVVNVSKNENQLNTQPISVKTFEVIKQPKNSMLNSTNPFITEQVRKLPPGFKSYFSNLFQK